MIIDCHAHIADHKSIPNEFVLGWSKSTYSSLLEEGISLDVIYQITKQMVHFDGGAEKLLSYMDKGGIDKTILLPIDFGYVFDELPKDYYKIININYCEIAKKSNNRFLSFVGLDPRRGEEGVAFFEKLISTYTVSGLKLYPPCGFYPNDDCLNPIYKICEKQKIPVLIHIGPTTSSLPFKYSDPKYVEDAAYKYPNVNFILAHGAIMFLEECIQICRYRHNVYMDMSGFQSIMKGGEFERHLRKIKNNDLAAKLLFGTDFPFHHTKWSYKNCLTALDVLFKKLEFSKLEINAIMGNNFKKLLSK